MQNTNCSLVVLENTFLLIATTILLIASLANLFVKGNPILFEEEITFNTLEWVRGEAYISKG